MKLSGVLLTLCLLVCYVKAAEPDPKTVELALTSMMSSVGNSPGLMYHVNFTVGTPEQLQTAIIDTGSSNTILLATNASFCESHGCHHGTFDMSESSTHETIHPGAFKQAFMRHSTWFKGDYVRDVVHMNDLVISKLPFGLANTLEHTVKPYTGILGLGYSSGMSHNRSHKRLPPTFVEGLVQAGAIPSRLYSIYMNTLDRYGSILFGGVDADKYKGPLTTLNIVSRHEEGRVDNFFLYLEEIKMQLSNGTSQTILRSSNDSKRLTLIDTGGPKWQVPESAFVKIIEQAGVMRSGKSWVRPCSEVTRGTADNTYLEITFAGNGSNTANLRVELADLFIPSMTKHGSAAIDKSGQPMCELAVLSVPSAVSLPYLITSNLVMRAGYWVFDMDNGQLSLAQANLGANSSDVVQVEAGPEGLEKVAKELKIETQRDEVEGLRQVSVAYELSTATKTIGYTTGIKSYPTPTGTGAREPSNVHNAPRKRGSPYVRRAENAAATMASLGAHVVWVLCAALIVAVGTIAV